MISPLLSMTSRLPLSLEFSEESSSTMRSGTAPVTRITSTWRRPATWVKEAEHPGVQRHPTDLRQKALYNIPGEQLHSYCLAISTNRKLNTPRPSPFHWLPLQSSCLTLSQIYLPARCLLESSAFLSLFCRIAHE